MVLLNINILKIKNKCKKNTCHHIKFIYAFKNSGLFNLYTFAMKFK